MKTHRILPCLSIATFVFAAVTLSGAETKDDVPPSVLKRYDTNRNGSLDEGERARWEADKAVRREKDKAKRTGMLEKYDINKDGKLSEDENAVAKVDRERDRSEREAAKMKERSAKEKAEKAAQAEKEAKAEQERLKLRMPPSVPVEERPDDMAGKANKLPEKSESQGERKDKKGAATMTGEPAMME